MPRFLLLALAGTLLGFAPTRSEDPGKATPNPDTALAKTAQGMFATLRSEKLDNGLQVYLLPIPGSPTVTTMVAYRVGSADEENDQTGLSHYLEHLMFKGTGKLMPGDIDRATQRNGGRNNAYTSEDMTVYHFDFASDRWKPALEIEADRMRNIRIDEKHEFEQEKGAVIAELKGGEDQPWDLEYKAILPILFPKGSPYAHPVIGEEQHVRGATAEIIKRHYDKWYHPNNAAIIIAGGFDPDDAMATIKKLFSSIPKGDLPPRKPDPKQPVREKQVRKEFESKFDVPRMMVGFNTVVVGDPDDYVLDVIDDVLTSGKTSRLHKRLIEEERLANDVSTSNNAGRYPGWFAVEVEMLKGKDRKKAETIVFEELTKLAKEPITEAELKRVRRGILAAYIFSREGIHSVADFTARSVMLANIDYLKTYLEKVMAVTPADVQRVAAKYLSEPKSVVVWSIPEGDEPKGKAEQPENNEKKRSRPHKLHRAADSGAAPAKGFSLKDAKRVVLPNGITLVMLENHRLPIVVAETFVADTRLREPSDKIGVATLVGDMLEEGTKTRTGEEISTAIENTGGSLAFSSAGGTLKVLTPDTDLGLGILFDCLMNPTFPKEALERKRDQQLSVIADVETQPQNRAKMHFNEIIYGEHPYGKSSYGKKAVVKNFTQDDLKKFHASAYGPDTLTVVVVGDFDSKELTRKIEKLTADWKPTGGKTPKPSAPAKLEKSTQKIVSDPTAAQTHIYIGHLGITRDNPDYYKLLVLDNVLGTGPGFTDRLSSTLRDRQGLAYTVTATITPTAGTEPGTFTGYIGTFPDKFTWVRDGFLKEFHRIRDEPPTAQEVDDAKKYLLGSLPFKLQTNEDVAGQLLAVERYGLGLDYLEKYRDAVSKVTPAEVQAVAKQYLDPKKLVIVAVGPIDQDGKPLKEEKEEK